MARVPAFRIDSSRRHSIQAVVVAALASALLLWASAPPVGVGPLAWIALVPAALVALSASGKAARVVVPLTYGLFLELLLVRALPFGLTEGEWGDTPIPILIAGSPVIVVALVAVPLFAAALYVIRFPTLRPRSGGAAQSVPSLLLLGAVLPATAWTALDFARTKVDPGGMWGPLFLSQHDTGAAELAALGGPWLITFAIVLVNFVIALALLRSHRGIVGAAVAVMLVGALAFSSHGLAADGERAVVAAVQPGYDTTEDEPPLRYFNPGTYDRAALDLIADLTPLTERAARQGATLIVWPEAAIWVDPVRTATVRGALARLVRSANASLVVPYFLPDLAQGATVIFGADARITRPQPKQRPMWFWGEDGGNRRPPAPVAIPGSSVGTLLGVDNQDPAAARRLASRGAELITSSTHDWGELASAQRAFAQLHAHESRTPVVRSDWRYGSAIIDADGRQVADAGSGRRRTTVLGRVTVHSESTPYMELGDAAGWVAIGAALFFLVATLFDSWRRTTSKSCERCSTPGTRAVSTRSRT